MTTTDPAVDGARRPGGPRTDGGADAAGRSGRGTPVGTRLRRADGGRGFGVSGTSTRGGGSATDAGGSGAAGGAGATRLALRTRAATPPIGTDTRAALAGAADAAGTAGAATPSGAAGESRPVAAGAGASEAAAPSVLPAQTADMPDYHPGAGVPCLHCPASDLVIAGLVPLSTVDWPGHLVATVFAQGCPWNCHYCHNQDLIPTRVPGKVGWREVRQLLTRRRGLLDGVVFTGGEALRQEACAAAAAETKALGFDVGLHTAGAYPRRLAELVSAGLVDWVGLDIKALPEHYRQVVGRPNAGAKAWECLGILVEAAQRGGPDFEVRTTVAPGDVTADDAFEAARRVHQAGARSYALQQARSEGARADFIAMAPGWDAVCERLAARIEALGWESFTYRPA